MQDSFIDDGPILKTTYYRLKQVDFDGQFKYSELKVLSPKTTMETQVYPNPATDEIFVEFNSQNNEEAEIILIDILGKPVKSFIQNLQTDQNLIAIDLKELASETYFLTIHSAHFNLNKKIILQ